MACKRSAVRSRVAPPLFRMNGRQNHSFSTEFGVIAQLGERLHGMQEVRGSIPRSSTKFLLQETKRPPHRGGLFVFSIIYFLHTSAPFICKSNDLNEKARETRGLCLHYSDALVINGDVARPVATGPAGRVPEHHRLRRCPVWWHRSPVSGRR